MAMAIRADRVKLAVTHLRRGDPVMRELIHRVGPFRLRLQRDRFRSLVRAIIAQQISTQAARTILGRLEALVPPGKLTPENLLAMPPETLRTAGISQQKARYLHDLAARAHDGRLVLHRLGRWKDEQIIDELVEVQGIGRWTAQMFLIFSLGRLDVLPVDDLGVRTAVRNLYGLESLPTRQQCTELGMPWRPYATVASWYCWRSLENA